MSAFLREMAIGREGDVAVTGGESIRVVAPSHTGRLDMAKGEGEDATNARPLVPVNEQPSVSCARAQQVRARVACTAWGAPQTSYDMLSSRKGMPALAHER